MSFFKNVIFALISSLKTLYIGNVFPPPPIILKNDDNPDGMNYNVTPRV